ncbi:uncharacterized protein G2W53_003829 [Senna tora]|uniref:Uncharacterized protein n=1 Tax=Senna tora TaxID=362788 RepID=A0A835CHD3_9FABA|nr:uncharacterized protein G2W53_003829 [Senna tora]
MGKVSISSKIKDAYKQNAKSETIALCHHRRAIFRCATHRRLCLNENVG